MNAILKMAFIWDNWRKDVMKTLLVMFVIGLSLMFAAESFACHIEFETESLQQANVGEVITVEAIVVKEHRKCVLEDTDVQVELSDNLKIVHETGWQTVGSKEIHNTLQIEVVSEGNSIVRVFRECSKKGISEGTFEFLAVQ
jgi:hypothetical protein